MDSFQLLMVTATFIQGSKKASTLKQGSAVFLVPFFFLTALRSFPTLDELDAASTSAIKPQQRISPPDRVSVNTFVYYTSSFGYGLIATVIAREVNLAVESSCGGNSP